MKAKRHEVRLKPETRAVLIKEAMASLVMDPRFRVFMDAVYDSKEIAQRDSMNDAVVGDLGKMSAALGEIRAFTAITDIYEHHLSQQQEQAQAEQEQAEANPQG